MSSPPDSPNKRSLTEKTSFIQITNPEVFNIQPRTGGLVPIKPVELKPTIRVNDEKKTTHKIEEKTSRDFRVHIALDETESIGSQEPTVPNPLNDAMYMFGITISTLIMMAAGHASMPQEYLQWTKNCLECIRDEFGNHPPNVQGILNHMRNLGVSASEVQFTDDSSPETSPTIETGEIIETSFADRSADETSEQTVITTTRTRLGSANS